MAVLNGMARVGCRKHRRLAAAGPKPLMVPIQRVDRLNQRLFAIAAQTRLQESSERPLMRGIFVDVRNPQLRFPQERVIGPLENLTLLGDRVHDGLQR